jgi:hypothetical protein
MSGKAVKLKINAAAPLRLDHTTFYLASIKLIYFEPETKRWNVETMMKQIKNPFSASTPSEFLARRRRETHLGLWRNETT